MFSNTITKHSSKKRRCFAAIASFTLMIMMQVAAFLPAFAQTKPAEAGQNQSVGNSQDPSQAGQQQTQNTVPNQYEDALGNLYRVKDAVPINQQNIDTGVSKILTGEYAPNVFQAAPQQPLVFQAAEQNQDAGIRQAANNILNASLGSVNDTYRGIHQFFKDDVVGNLFQNIGQLNGKWLSEFIDGWISDAAQFLGRFLRVFVLNPNIAVNGLNGQPDDGISKYIREGADIMYGIAVDLLLLLFILCIWKFWADASWGGAGNLMGPVGRLIFTAGLLLAWPTIYAFEIQISNEMIKAVYANNPEQVMMLDYALAQIVKGGVIAAGAGATDVFAPIFANLALPVGGQFVGNLFHFASTMIFTILGGIIVAELVYIIILKAIQTALLTAQYMFAPIFLVFFATPDTESYATGYVRAFVETSLWTFVWVGLLKILVIILFSNFNPWGKILISIGVLQIMIQVPSFLGRAQISPVSDFVSAGLVFGGLQKALGGLKEMGTALVDKGANFFANDSFANKGLNASTNTGMPGLPGQTKSPELLNALNKASQGQRDRMKSIGSPADPGLVLHGPGVKTPGVGDGAPHTNSLNTGKDLHGLTGPTEKKDTKLDPASGKALNPQDAHHPALTVPVAEKKDVNGKMKAGTSLNSGHLAALAGAAESAAQNNPGQKSGTPELPKGTPQDTADKQQGNDRFEWGKTSAEGWDSGNLIHVDTRKMLAKMTSADGIGLRVGQSKTSALGSAANGVQRLNIAEGASDSELSHAIYACAFANNVASDDPARDAARKAAVQAGAQQPQGLLENMAANWLGNTGSSWNKTAMSKERFQQAMFGEAVKGSQAFVSRTPGNAYTDYLKDRYGEWGDKQDAEAVHLITNPDSSESPWNRNVGPATDSLVSSGIPIDKDTRGAMQNPAIQSMHPARRKQAVFAALSYTYQQAREHYGDPNSSEFKLAHGEMARALPSDDLNNALTMYQISGQEDLNSSMAPTFICQTAGLAAATQKDFATAYTCMATAAPHAARRLGYIAANHDISGINSYSDLAAVIRPREGESNAGAMQVILESTGSTLASMESHRIPMATVTNPAASGEMFNFLASHAADGLSSVASSRAYNIVAKNLGTMGAPHSARSMEAMYSYAQNGGSLEALDQAHIVIATRAYEDRGAAGVRPHVIEVALNQGYAMSDSQIPWADLERTAMHYQTGQVTDYRLSGVVGQMVNNKIPVNRQNIQLAVETIAANGGHMDADHVNAVIRVTEAVRSSASSPIVLDTFARVEANRNGINTDHMQMGEVLRQLENLPNQSHSAGSISQQIVQLSRQGGGFSDHQLQDPLTVELLLDHGNSHPYAPQAINVVTRLLGSTEAYKNPGYINIVEEYLDNDGKMREMDLSNLHAAAALAEARAAATHSGSSADWNNVKISPSILKMMQRDPGYSAGSASHQLNDALVERILRAAGRMSAGSSLT